MAVILLRGPNGSGKTSLLRHLAGLPPRGRRPDVADPVPPASPEEVGWAPQRARDALVGLTVAGEFRMRRRPVPPGLAPRSDQESATLSAGEARRIGLDLLEGPLWLLDEPLTDLDEAARRALLERVRHHDGTVVIADHTGLVGAPGGSGALVADRVVELAAVEPTRWPDVPAMDGPVVLASDAAVVHGRHLPAVALPAGLHAIVGPNGSGKTTLLRRLAGLESSARVHGHAARPGVDVRLAPEDMHALFAAATVEDELAGLDAPGLVPDDLLPRHPLAISRGEAQRVGLAQALGAPAPVILLDEPESHLDAQAQAAMLELVARRIRGGACVVVATHTPRLAGLAQSRLALARGAP